MLYSISATSRVTFSIAILAQMHAETFIQKLLIEGLNVAYLVVGDDFRLWQDRLGWTLPCCNKRVRNKAFSSSYCITLRVDANLRVQQSRTS